MSDQRQGVVKAVAFPHFQIMRVAETLHELSKTAGRGKEGDLRLGASIFAFFAFEGFVNEMLRRTAPTEFKNEQDFFTRKSGYSGTMGKFAFLAERSAHQPDQQQLKTVSDLKAGRDSAGHSKAVVVEKIVPLDQAVLQAPAFLFERWRKATEVAQAIEHVGALADGLHSSLEAKYGSAAVGFSTSAFYGNVGEGELSALPEVGNSGPAV